MSDKATDRLFHILDEITISYDKLRKYESEGCSKNDLEKILIHVRDVVGEIPSMMTVWYKENPSQMPIIQQFIPIIRPSFTQTLHMQLLLFASTPNPDSAWIKTQIEMAIGYINGDGWIDIIKAFRTFLRQ